MILWGAEKFKNCAPIRVGAQCGIRRSPARAGAPGAGVAPSLRGWCRR